MNRIAPVALVVALSLGSSAFAQQSCGSDKDCAGNAVCEQGVCVESGAPVAAGSSDSMSPALTRKLAIKLHPLVPIVFLAAGLSAMTPVLLLAVPLELEAALAPNLSVLGLLTPLYASGAGGSAFGASLLAGVRYYFYGTALDGAFVGGMLGAGVVATTLPGFTAPIAGFDGQLQVGYQWVFQSGFTIGVVGTWSPVALVTSLGTTQIQTGLGFQVPLGLAF